MILLKPEQSQMESKVAQLQQKLSLSQRQWQINDGNFTKYGLQELIAAAMQIDTLKLILYQNYHGILKDLTVCQFPTLKILNLSLNNIESLEPINNLSMPRLQSITLFKNRISQIMSLRKSVFSDLQELLLNNNYIIEFEALEQCQFPKIKKLFININKCPSANTIGFKFYSPNGMEQLSTRNNILRMSHKLELKLQKKIKPSPRLYI